MKTCSICSEDLPLEAFDVQSTGRQGRRADCKECRKRFLRSERGLCKSLLGAQKTKSKKRGHPPPAYTEEQLFQWMLGQPNFQKLYAAWVDSGFTTPLKPSMDRLDDYQPYTLNNIKLTTTEDNLNRYYTDAIQGINTKTAVAVDQYTLDGVFVASHHSYMAAARSLGQSQIGNIRNVAEGIGKTAYGYIWRKP